MKILSKYCSYKSRVDDIEHHIYSKRRYGTLETSAHRKMMTRSTEEVQ